MSQGGGANACTKGTQYGGAFNSGVNQCNNINWINPPFTHPFTSSSTCTTNSSFTFAGNSGPWAFGYYFSGNSCQLNHGPPLWFYQNPAQVPDISFFFPFCP
jgi:hypothetical protein